MSEAIGVLVVDDHPVVRDGLRTFLGTQPDIEVLGEAANGEQAVEFVTSSPADVVLMDLVMPGIDGIEATRRIVEMSPATKVIVLTSYADDERVFPAIKAGAWGYLLTYVEPSELAEAIRKVFKGESLLHPTIAARLMQEVSQSERTTVGALTDRELEVLKLIARGMSNREIASDLTLSEKTVKTHVSNILAKLHLADRTQAALYAVRRGLADPDEG